jgi:succinoglycan biosynthesis transport protein ExoP
MNFSQFVAVLRARWQLAALVFLTTVTLAVVLSLVLPKKYTGSASVVVEVKPDPITGMFGTMMNPSMMATQVDIIGSDRVARRVIRNLKLDQSEQVRAQWQEDTDGKGTVEDWLVDLFQKQLDVKPSRESNVIVVSYKAPDPNFAAALANAFVQAYVDTSLELRVDPARQYSGFFDKRAKEARDTLEAAQTKLSEYQRENGIVGNDERLDVETGRLNELSSQLVQMQAVASESNSRRAQIRKGNGEGMTEALNNPVIGNLKVDLGRAEANLEELNTRLGPNHPQVQQVRANIAELRSRIAAEVKRVGGGVGITASVNSARVREVREQLDAQRAKVLQMKEGRDAMAVLQRDVESAQRAYETINTRLTQTSLESQTQQSNVSILSAATPPLIPSSPKLLLNTLLAIFLGGLLAVGSTLVREFQDRRVRGAQDLVDALGLPMLGVIPRPIAGGGKRAKLSLMAQRVISGRLPAPGKQ